jgi:hypothetical protein
VEVVTGRVLGLLLLLLLDDDDDEDEDDDEDSNIFPIGGISLHTGGG